MVGAWIALLTAGVVGGAAACAGLVVPRSRIWIPTIVGTLALLSIAAATTVVWRIYSRVDTAATGVFIAVAAALGGFALASSAWPDLLERRRMTSAPFEPGPDDGTLHVVLLADAEPESYSPAHLSRVMKDLEDSDVPVPPDAVRSLFYAQERARYRTVGGSPSRPTARAVAVRTSALLSDRGAGGHASVAFCTGAPSLADVIADEVSAGGRRFVIAQLTAADSREMDLARRGTAGMELWKHGVEIAYTSPLWSAAGIAEMLAARVLAALEGPPSDSDGVILVSEGQPWQWDRTHPAAAEHATFMCQRARAELVTAGLREDKVRTAWMAWDDPDVTEVVRHLAAIGCRRILIAPATMPFDSIATLLDLRSAAHQASVSEGVTLIVLPAWGDEEAVAEALCQRILSAAQELDRPEAAAKPDSRAR